MPTNQKESLFDVRTLGRNLSAGRVRQDEVDGHLAQLEDLEDMADWTTTRMAKPAEAEAEEPTTADQG